MVFFYAIHRKFMSLGVKGFTEEKEFHGVAIILQLSQLKNTIMATAYAP